MAEVNNHELNFLRILHSSPSSQVFSVKYDGTKYCFKVVGVPSLELNVFPTDKAKNSSIWKVILDIPLMDAISVVIALKSKHITFSTNTASVSGATSLPFTARLTGSTQLIIAQILTHSCTMNHNQAPYWWNIYQTHSVSTVRTIMKCVWRRR